jgi:hypothetical protein
VENLVMMQLNPDLINNRFHRMVVRELAKKGLREVQPGQNPDLVVRYWANSSQQVNLAAMGNWGPYGPYVGSYRGWIHTTASASSTRGFLDRGFDRPQQQSASVASLPDSQNY